MRIIAGTFRSRILKTLKGSNTRPMTDRMKESVFNTIGPYFDGGLILDLFGGSGALSLESISRGANKAYIIDSSREAVQIIKENVQALNVQKQVEILNMSYQVALKKLNNLQFDLIFLDPPYRLNVINEIVDYLLANKMIQKDAYIICHYVKGNVEIIKNLTLIKNYAYGSSEVSIYKMD